MARHEMALEWLYQEAVRVTTNVVDSREQKQDEEEEEEEEESGSADDASAMDLEAERQTVH
jgi:hypothetical protein